jgi:hypothetical protein
MIKVTWVDLKREPQCAPDPAYPTGKHIDVSNGAKKTCKVDLPYPAQRCGYFTLRCGECGYGAVITTAGRADDPRTVLLPCKEWRR